MAKQIPGFQKLGTALLLIIVVTAAPARALAATQPYFRVTGGDVWAGGWIDSKSGSCGGSTNYQRADWSDAPDFPSDAAGRYGGILAYATANNGSGQYTGGAAADFGAFALGSIDASSANDGFASGAAAPNPKDYLSFANFKDTASYWGGKFEGSTGQIHCIPDYYDKRSTTSSSNGTNVPSLNSVGGAGVFYGTAPSATQPYIVNSSTFNVPKNSKITMFVNGPAYIGADIIYDTSPDPSGPYSVDDVQKFALVVQGSLYIGPNVHQLDGLYIAQPSNPTGAAAVKDDNGEIWTCHDGTTQVPASTYPAANCGGQLVVNGALIAKRVNLLRTSGDINSNNAAEVINYTPAMAVNGPFFNPKQGTLKIESLVSLPPVF